MITKNLELRAWDKNHAAPIIVQGESESRTLEIILTGASGQPVNLANASARLYIIKPDGKKVFSDGTITDALGGAVQFKLDSQASATAGTAECQILVNWPDNSSLKFVGLSLNIQPSNLESAAESTNEYSALVVALNSIETALGQVETALSDAQTAVTNANQAVVAANTASTAVSAATQSANAAASAANTAAQNASSLYQMINPLTGLKDYVTNIVDGLTAYIFRDAITAGELDNLNITEQSFDALNITAMDFDTRAKILLL